MIVVIRSNSGYIATIKSSPTVLKQETGEIGFSVAEVKKKSKCFSSWGKHKQNILLSTPPPAPGSATHLCIASLYPMYRQKPVGQLFPSGGQQSVGGTNSTNLGAYQACGQGRPDSGWSKQKAAGPQQLHLPSEICLCEKTAQWKQLNIHSSSWIML